MGRHSSPAYPVHKLQQTSKAKRGVDSKQYEYLFLYVLYTLCHIIIIIIIIKFNERFSTDVFVALFSPKTILILIILSVLYPLLGLRLVILCFVYYCLVVGTCVTDFLERLVSEMTLLYTAMIGRNFSGGRRSEQICFEWIRSNANHSQD